MYRIVRYNKFMTTKKVSTSIRLSPEAIQLLKILAKKLGVSQAAIIEMSIRKFAQQEQTMKNNMIQITQEDDRGYIWLDDRGFENVETLIDALRNAAPANEWHADGFNVYATNNAYDAAVKWFEAEAEHYERKTQS